MRADQFPKLGGGVLYHEYWSKWIQANSPPIPRSCWQNALKGAPILDRTAAQRRIFAKTHSTVAAVSKARVLYCEGWAIAHISGLYIPMEHGWIELENIAGRYVVEPTWDTPGAGYYAALRLSYREAAVRLVENELYYPLLRGGNHYPSVAIAHTDALRDSFLLAGQEVPEWLEERMKIVESYAKEGENGGKADRG